jgi:hypothetical protein
MSLSRYRAAQVAVGVLVVITIRSLAEFLGLYKHSATPLGPELLLYIYGALTAAVGALATLVFHAFGRHLSAIVLTGTVIAGLFVYKIVVVT